MVPGMTPEEEASFREMLRSSETEDPAYESETRQFLADLGLKNPEKLEDSLYSKRTKIRRGNNVEEYDTRVIATDDLKQARAHRYQGFYGIEWVLTDLIKRYNREVEKGEIKGDPIKEGDVVQAFVFSYFLNEDLLKPKTTEDSPSIETGLYVVITAPEGYLITKLLYPNMYAKTITQIGELIPDLTEEERNKVLIALKLNKLLKKDEQELKRIIEEQPKKVEYEPVEDKDAEAFFKKDLGQSETTVIKPQETLYALISDMKAQGKSEEEIIGVCFDKNFSLEKINKAIKKYKRKTTHRKKSF